MIAGFLPFLDKGYSGYVVAFMFLILNIVQLKKDKRQATKPLYERVVEGAINRQNELDKKQLDMMASLKEESSRMTENYNERMKELKEEGSRISESYNNVMEELGDERERYRILSDKYSQLIKDKIDLIETVSNLKESNSEMVNKIEELEKQLHNIQQNQPIN